MQMGLTLPFPIPIHLAQRAEGSFWKPPPGLPHARWHLSPLLMEENRNAASQENGMHVHRMGHSGSDAFSLNFLKELFHGTGLWASSGFLGPKTCKFPEAESPNAINYWKKGSIFFNSLPCTWPTKALPSYDENFPSAAWEVLHKSPNTLYPSPRASATRIFNTKQSDSGLPVGIMASTAADQDVEESATSWKGKGPQGRTDGMTLTDLWVRTWGRNERYCQQHEDPGDQGA